MRIGIETIRRPATHRAGPGVRGGRGPAPRRSGPPPRPPGPRVPQRGLSGLGRADGERGRRAGPAVRPHALGDDGVGGGRRAGRGGLGGVPGDGAGVAAAHRRADAGAARRAAGGRPTPGLAARAAAGLDLPEHGPYAVVVLRVERRDAREAFHRRIQDPGFRFVWRMRADCEVGVVGLGTDRTLDDVSALLDGRCPGPGGISPVVTGPRRTRPRPSARRARPAHLSSGHDRCGPARPADADGPRGEPARSGAAPGLRRLGEPSPSNRLADRASAPGDSLSRRRLLPKGSAGRAAGRLYCHRNTVFNRLHDASNSSRPGRRHVLGTRWRWKRWPGRVYRPSPG
ncbi:PucR family transcriptional regulator [Streptomyces sp. KL116D]|uniref:PucR family transcriptional regulator n=1 Tax=Streptomyces sp. KL116D TaxID=3045152 RepID=UPI0035562B54